jgi:hypothetical protein
MATMSILRLAFVLAVGVFLSSLLFATKPSHKYTRIGHAEDAKTKTTAGYALICFPPVVIDKGVSRETPFVGTERLRVRR